MLVKKKLMEEMIFQSITLGKMQKIDADIKRHIITIVMEEDVLQCVKDLTILLKHF